MFSSSSFRFEAHFGNTEVSKSHQRVPWGVLSNVPLNENEAIKKRILNSCFKVKTLKILEKEHQGTLFIQSDYILDACTSWIDIFKYIWTIGCFNPIGRFVNTLLIYQNLVGDMWILRDFLNVMLLRYDEQKKNISFSMLNLYINKYGIVKI